MAMFGVGEDEIGKASDIPLGLDLQGGLSVTYEITNENPSQEEIDTTIDKLQRRVDEYSSEGEVYQEGDDRITVEIPVDTEKHDAHGILEELGQPGQLLFLDETNYGLWAQGQPYEAAVEGSDVKNAEVLVDNSGVSQEYVVGVTFNDAGRDKFASATAANVGKPIYIIYDNINRRVDKMLEEGLVNEVKKLLDSIDLGNPCGIRDYAIILLIARLGLRSSDVANLRFSNIDWEKEVIRLTQVKTGNSLELPLLEDVGEAIINYLKSARPKTDSDHVFVRQVPPYTEFNPGAVGSLVRVHLQKSGIHLEGKKKGSHPLRHSLASRLLEHKIPLPVISEILGHTTTETTTTYLRIDITELKKCALEVSI